tara:strand:+ start:350 stop:658 length:309 start_codon:yes stop_codon:yes gene_type:complete
VGNIKYCGPLSDKKTFEISSDVNKIIKGTIYIKTLGGKIAFKAIITTTAHTNCDKIKDVSLFPFDMMYHEKQKTIIASRALLKNTISLKSIKKLGMSSGKLP